MAEAAPKLVSLELRPYAVAFARPWKSARGTTTRRTGWIIRARDAGGATGWGECAPLPGAGTESGSKAAAALQAAVERLPGMTADAALSACPGRDTPAARFGVEGALLDLLARRAGLPLYRYLAPAAPGTVAVNAFGGALDDGLPERLAAAREAGFSVVKLKLATRPRAEELAALEQAAAGSGGESWRLDVNRGWDLAGARAAWARMNGLPLEAVEEPASDADAAALADLQARANFAVALDESLGQWPQDAPLPVRRQVLKPMVVGGPGAVLGLAARPGAESVVTSSVETAVGLWHAAHLAAALDNGLAHGLDTGPWLRDLMGPALPIRAGTLRLGPEAGLGWSPPAP